MKISNYTDEIFSKILVNQAAQLLQFSDSNFCALVHQAGLNPKSDFRCTDLRDVDFSDCDLRGFDFTGSDLRGSIGANVIWSIGDPILEDADTADSLFSYAISQRDYFNDNPDEFDFVDRLAADYWANSVLAVERLLQGKGKRESAIKIATAVFDRTGEATVRTNILLFLRIATDSSVDHKAFICSILSRYSDDMSVTVSGIRALAAFYSSHTDAFNWLLKYLKHPNQFVRAAAFVGVVRSPRFKDGLREATCYVQECDDGSHRRAFLGRASGLLGPQFQSAVFDRTQKSYFDFKFPIPEDALRAYSAREFEEFRIDNYKLKIEDAHSVFLARRVNMIERIARHFSLTLNFESKKRK